MWVYPVRKTRPTMGFGTRAPPCQRYQSLALGYKPYRKFRCFFVRTARAKGLSERKVIYKHAFKNALVNIIPVIGIQAGFVLGGAVYIETVFQWPGIGRMLVTAITTRDILLVQGGVLLVAACYVLFNLLADVLQRVLDPRLET